MTFCNGDFSHPLWWSLKISFFSPFIFSIKVYVILVQKLNIAVVIIPKQKVEVLHPKLSSKIFCFPFIWLLLKYENLLLYLF